ncbi:MAG TPA: DUF3592 domain-containing protein [Herpetosiphonaceae bacterium]
MNHPPFVFHPRNRDFTLGLKPRPSHGGAFTLISLLFLAPFILAGLFLIVAVAREWTVLRQLTAGGATTQGVVLGKRIVEDSEGDDHYVRYGFRAMSEGHPREFVAERTVRREQYEQLRVEGPVAVRYYAADPALSRVEGAYGSGLPTFLTCFAAFWNLCIGGLTYAAIRERRDYRLLRERGVVIDGIITNAEGSTDSDGDYNLTVHYQFWPAGAAPGGTVLAGKESQVRNDLKALGAPPPGTPVRIWYAAPALFRLI